TEIVGNNVISGGIGHDHMGVWRVVAAEGKTAGRRIYSVRGSDRAGQRACGIVIDHIGRARQGPVRLDWDYGHVSTAVIRHEHEFPKGVDAHVSRTASSRSHGIESCQITV